jgi:hypothetical protein
VILITADCAPHYRLVTLFQIAVVQERNNEVSKLPYGFNVLWLYSPLAERITSAADNPDSTADGQDLA